MNRFLHLIIIAATLLGTSLSGYAGLSAAEAFISAPKEIYPSLPHNTRLDMIDYFNSNMSVASPNTLNGASRITALSPMQATIELSDVCSSQISIVPCGADTIIVLITTVSTPHLDSRVQIFTSDWTTELTNKSFSAPSLKQWLTSENDSKQNLALLKSTIPFLLTSCSIDPDDTTLLTITNNTLPILSPDDADKIGHLLAPSLRYRLKGKKFIPEKNK